MGRGGHVCVKDLMVCHKEFGLSPVAQKSVKALSVYLRGGGAQVSEGQRERDRERSRAHLKWGSSSPDVLREPTNCEMVT